MTDKEEKELIKRRGSYKGRLTAFSNYLEDLSKNESLTQAQVNELQLRIGKIELVYTQYDELQLKLECIAEDISIQISERNEFESLFYRFVGKAQDLFSSNNDSINSEKCSRASNNKLVKLPTIQLQKFSGTYDTWLGFRDQFISLIHSNDSIDEINKFHYLRASLVGTAAIIIQSIDFSASNYSIAWKLLCERFDHKRLLIQNHVTSLFNIEAVNKESSENIKRIIDSVTKNLRALESLGEPVDSWGTLLIHLVTQKLDQKTYREWEEQKSIIDKNESITFDTFLKFLRSRSDLLETLDLSRYQSSHSISKLNYKHKTLVSVSDIIPQNKNKCSTSLIQPKCPMCSNNHYLTHCPKFLGLSNNQRLEILPKYKLCFNCFKSGHYANFCKSNGCKICKRKHNTLVHVADAIRRPIGEGIVTDSLSPENKPNQNVILTAHVPSHIQNKNQVFLATALVNVYDQNNCQHLARAILDSGSTSCIATNRLHKILNLPTVKVNESIQGINNCTSQISEMCYLKIKSLSEHYISNVYCFILPTITDDVPSQQLKIRNLNIPSDICLADPHFHVPAAVDLIIGANIFWDLLGQQKIHLGIGKPILFESRLGWLVSGSINNSEQTVSDSVSNLKTYSNVAITGSNINSSEDDIQNLLMRFWQLEEVGHQSSSLSPEEKRCEEHFLKNTTRLSDGRFCVRIPLKESSNILGNSFARAKNCLISLERRFKNQPGFKRNYCDFMKEYISLGHMTECIVPENELTYYIPHHGVFRDCSSTTKLRVVFNASSPTTSGISSNDIQIVGLVVQDDLFSILLRFRKHKYIISADVEKMYRQVLVHPEDRHLQRILWREDISEPIKTYELATVTYGTASAPFLATRCLKQVGMLCADPEVANIILHDFYVDDMLSGGDTGSQIEFIREKLSKELDSAGMPLRKWKSNYSVVSDQDSCSSLNLNIGSTEPSKTLGLNWQTQTDELCFTINTSLSNKLTKRVVLSVISQTFDPLGLLSVYVIAMKMLMQKLWVHKLSWDDSLPPDLEKTWTRINDNLSYLNNLRIPRCVLSDSWKIINLHIFCDSSQFAYGSCVYVWSVNQIDEVLVRLLTAKSRVAPIKPVSIPRLELCAALVGVRLYEKVINSLHAPIQNVTFWTDSTIVSGWLKIVPNKLQPFVRNRVAEIVEKTNTCIWRHVPSNLNPADLLSRGIAVSQTVNANLWWPGPEFLKKDSSKWPHSPTIVEQLPETRDEVSLLAHAVTNPSVLIEFSRFSNFNRLKRTVAYVLRFINLCKKQPPTTQQLNETELESALNLLVKLCQTDSFPERSQLINKQQLPKGSPLTKLNVFIDENNLIRVGGRLENSPLDYNKKHPVVIQSIHRFSKLLFEYMHKKLMHSGPQLLLACIRESYWPIGGRNLAKSCYHRCIVCSRMRGKPTTPLMGSLPQHRVTPGGYPFECVGVDYAGPIMSASRQGRGCKIVKVYILLFVCFATKAIHIELAGNLTSANYLMALRRFISRRGKPRHIYSDNGTAFVGACNDIGNFLKANGSSLSGDLANEGINFHFIPPGAPHFGGLWEAGIKSVKYHLKRVLGDCKLTFEELYTALVQIEALLNSRPLTPLSSEPEDFLPLTPGHFLIGRPLTSLPSKQFEAVSITYLQRHDRIQVLRQHFWSRWTKEYVSELQQRTKWMISNCDLQKNTLVVIKEDNLPPLKWRLGRITEVYPGPDGINRVADVRTACGTVRRAFSKICPLPLGDDSSC